VEQLPRQCQCYQQAGDGGLTDHWQRATLLKLPGLCSKLDRKSATQEEVKGAEDPEGVGPSLAIADTSHPAILDIRKPG